MTWRMSGLPDVFTDCYDCRSFFRPGGTRRPAATHNFLQAEHLAPLRAAFPHSRTGVFALYCLLKKIGSTITGILKKSSEAAKHGHRKKE
jgi:hypothetical protein